MLVVFIKLWKDDNKSIFLIDEFLTSIGTELIDLQPHRTLRRVKLRNGVQYDGNGDLCYKYEDIEKIQLMRAHTLVADVAQPVCNVTERNYQEVTLVSIR